MSKHNGRSSGPSPIDRIVKFEAEVAAKVNAQNKLLGEVVTKHNDLAAKIEAVEHIAKQIAAFTASEMGKFQGTVMGHIGTLGRTTQGLDLNVLAMAEILKEVVGQLTQADAIFQKLAANAATFLNNSMLDKEKLFASCFELSEEEIATVKTEAEAWYKELLKSSFKTARESIEAAEAEAMAREQAEREAAEKAALAAQADQKEEAAVEKELKDAATAERTVATSVSGGQGSPFPEGAEIFGG